MKKYQLLRAKSTDEGTPGMIWREGFEVKTIELPWKNNEVDFSCFPAGLYIIEPYVSSHHGKCLKVNDVPGRTNIRIHKGNWAGDSTKNLRTDSRGCPVVGESFTTIYNQFAVKDSGLAMKRLLEEITESAQLEVIWQEDV